MRIGVCADLHFGRGGEQMTSRYAATIDEMVTGMLEAGVDMVAVCGDTFDKEHHVNSYTNHVIAFSLFRLAERGVMVVLMDGNHDFGSGEYRGKYSAVHAYKSVGHGHVLAVNMPHVELVEIAGEKALIVCLPWMRKSDYKGVTAGMSNEEVFAAIYKEMVLPGFAVARGEIEKYKAQGVPSIVFFHATVTGAATGSGFVPATNDFVLKAEDLMGLGADYVVGGHYHKRQFIGEEICYVGAMERGTFGEKDNPCGWMLIDTAQGGYQFIELKNAAEWVEIDLRDQGPVTTERVLEAVPGRVNGYVKFRYVSKRNDPVDSAVVEVAARQAGAWDVKFDAEYEDVDVVRVAGMAADMDEAALLEGYLGANEKMDPNGVLKRLYEFERSAGFKLVNRGPESVEHFRAAMEVVN